MFRSRKIQALATAGALALVISACGSSSDDDASDSTTTTAAANSATTGGSSTAPTDAVKADIQGFEFPATLTIKAGQTVTWTNKDSAMHTVTSGANRKSDGKFDGRLENGESFSYTFKTAGTYEYYCKPHTNMVAKVIVQ